MCDDKKDYDNRENYEETLLILKDIKLIIYAMLIGCLLMLSYSIIGVIIKGVF